jgi:hypothetical protein
MWSGPHSAISHAAKASFPELDPIGLSSGRRASGEDEKSPLAASVEPTGGWLAIGVQLCARNDNEVGDVAEEGFPNYQQRQRDANCNGGEDENSTRGSHMIYDSLPKWGRVLL